MTELYGTFLTSDFAPATTELRQLAALSLTPDELELFRVHLEMMEASIQPQHCYLCAEIAGNLIHKAKAQATFRFFLKNGSQGFSSLLSRIRQLQGKSE